MAKCIYNKIVVLLALLAGVGCSDNTAESLDVDSGFSDDAVGFSSFVWDDSETKSSVTRGAIVEDFVAGDSMGVYAYYLPVDGSVDALEVSPNFMYNQKFIKQSDGSWSYSPTKYWSNNPNDEYLFFGYAPYSENEENTMYYHSSNDTITYPVIVHSTPTEMLDSRDLVLAGRKCNKYDDNGDITTVSLTFEHVLSRLRFEFLNNLIAESRTYSMVIKSLSLINATTQSAFTYVDDPDPSSETGLLLVEYIAEEVQGTGTISGSVASGALMGKGVEGDIDLNGYSASAYIPYYDKDSGKYGEYTPLMLDGEYLFLDPYVVSSSKVYLSVEVEVYARDYNVDGDEVWVYALNNTGYIEVTDLVESMSRGGSYVWKIKYAPIEGSALMVYVIEYWDDVYNKHDM